MNDETLLLFLRLLAGASLLVFMGSVAFMLLRDLQQAASSAQTRTAAHGRLVVVLNGESGSLVPGTELPLALSTTIGRAPSNTIQIEDDFASNEHARIMWRLGQWWLEDRKSSNGTLLNDLPVKETIVLSSGDLITIGHVELRVELN